MRHVSRCRQRASQTRDQGRALRHGHSLIAVAAPQGIALANSHGSGRVHCFALVAAILVVRSIRRHDLLIQWRQTLERAAGQPPWPDWSASWAPLPQPRRRANQLPLDLNGPYAFAALHPDVLRHIPCYCGCVHEGHQSNLSCFVERFRPDGTPVWTAHSFDCEMCVHIAREVMLMSSRGVALEVIRAEVDKYYGALGRSTETPMPGASGQGAR